MTKERKEQIKKALRDLKSNKELVDVYDQLISRYEDIRKEQNGVLEVWQQQELIEWKCYRLNLFKKVDALEKGINCLNNYENDKLQDIIKLSYIDNCLRVKVAQDVNLSEERVKQLLERAYLKLDEFII